MFKKFIFIVLALIALLLVIAWTRPDTYTVERTRQISASPQQLYGLVGDFSQWPRWSPWEQLDPNMQRVLSTPASGVGASYDWSGNQEAGKGRMQIRSAKPYSGLEISLNFIEPMESNNTMEFAFTPQGDSTLVTWTMVGQHNFASKIMSVFMSFDRLIGKDFDKGLDNLAREAADSPAAESDAIPTASQ